jgi:hypothetical protein
MVACAVCGEENPARARFCLNCGTPMGAAAGGEARKVVTVVFSDLAGSTSLGERLDPESLAREAVDLAARTDHLEEHADALMTLAEVLRRAGRAAEATPALSEALRLYEQKGNTVLARRAREALARPS